MRRAAIYGDGWLPYMYTPEMVRNSLEKISQFRKEAGKDMSSFRAGLFIFTSIYPDRDKALKQAAAMLAGAMRRIFRR